MLSAGIIGERAQQVHKQTKRRRWWASRKRVGWAEAQERGPKAVQVQSQVALK